MGVTSEERAKDLFDAGPFNHPQGRTPSWDEQPEHIKDVFRRKARVLCQTK